MTRPPSTRIPGASGDHLPVDPFERWVAALKARHLAELRISEVSRALRALSSAYVERRHKVAAGATLDSRGKRAAFGLYYAPLHFLTVRAAVDALDASIAGPPTVHDLGCGTGAAGAAWALASDPPAVVHGVDRHPWAVGEASWTYRTVGLKGSAHQGDGSHLSRLRPGEAVIAAYVLNELGDLARQRLEHRLLDAAARGVRILVVEPIARGITPWWKATAARVAELGGRADEWRFTLDLPPLVRTLAHGAGLRAQTVTARTLFLPGSPS